MSALSYGFGEYSGSGPHHNAIPPHPPRGFVPTGVGTPPLRENGDSALPLLNRETGGNDLAMPVENLGPEEVVTTGKESTVADVASTLKEENVGAVVVSEDDEPIGIVTGRDVALTVADGDAGSRQVSEVMTENPATLREDDEAIEISRAIGEHNVRRFPVVDDDGKLSGIVTLDDLVATIGEQLDDVAETVEAQSPGHSP